MQSCLGFYRGAQPLNFMDEEAGASEATGLSQGHKLVKGRTEAWPWPRRTAAPLSPPAGLKSAPSTLVFIWPPHPHSTRIRGEPDTPPPPLPRSRGQASQPYGQGRSPSAALASANLWVVGEEGRASGCRVPVPRPWAESPEQKGPPLPSSPLLSAAPHVLRLVHRPGPRPRPPLAAPRLPPLPPPPATRLGCGST